MYILHVFLLASFAITNELGRDSGDIMVERPLKAAQALAKKSSKIHVYILGKPKTTNNFIPIRISLLEVSTIISLDAAT